ncbi:MAG TPA: hypothetical protein VGI85_03805 [Chthoniobacterales bacterium]|jgi:hypothetical protein
MLRIPAALTLVFFLALGFSSCGPGSTNEKTATASAAPLSPLDLKINEYEKTAKRYVRLAKKHDAGDYSDTMLLIDLTDKTRTEVIELQREAATMTPAQARRVADISAMTAPYRKH